MGTSEKIRFREIFRNMGTRNVIASLLIFLLILTATFAGGWRLYQSARENIHLRGRMTAVQSAKEFDAYLLIRKNTVLLAGHVVDAMMREGQPNSRILEYLTNESVSIKRTIDKDYTGLYGWINREYLDGVGWVPDPDYVPVERPWYTETMEDDSEITFVKPYLDDQTKTVLTTIARQLSDGESVIALDITLGRIQEITEDITRDTRGSYGIVLDKDGQVIAHTDKTQLGKNYREETDTLGAMLMQALDSGNNREFELNYYGQKYLVFEERIEGDWQAISLINTQIFYQPLMLTLLMLALFTLLEAYIFLMILRNLSEKNQALASAEAAEKASRAKSQFLSRMSHEIRTPINAIIGLDSIALRDESISPHTREELNKIGASARHLLSLVNDILDMSRIEAGKLELKERRFMFRDLLEEIEIIIGGQCQEKGLRFISRCPQPVDDEFVGDSLKLKQVLINILGNAVKFTDAPGEISLTSEQTGSEDGKAFLRFTISDTGIGMDKEYLSRLFEAFSQEDAGSTTRFGGSGLGLTITKNIVAMMGGDIQVESEKGVGSTFTVTVTLKQVDEAAPAEDKEKDSGRASSDKPAEESQEAEDSLAGMHVLIVEDQELNAEILIDLLEIEGATSEWAENGEKGVELFKAAEEGHFDVILMDIRMPVMDGLTATRAIRQLPRADAATVPIFALSANAFEEDVRECLEAGMNRHLAKPIDVDQLLEALRSV